MNPRFAAVLLGASLCLGAPVRAQIPPSAAASSASAPRGTPEPKVQRSVTEDNGARVDELRVRGQTQRIVVHSKIASAPEYEVGTTTDGRDTSQDKRSDGRTLWRLLSF